MPFKSAPAWALLAGAAFWGVVWFPYRLLNRAGLDGLWATLFTYGVALVIGLLVFHRAVRVFARLDAWTILMAAAIGWSNLAYVIGVLEGEVMRVLLLFYLAPLWTVPLAWGLLHERLDGKGMVVMALALAGAMTMLWHPEMGMPFPRGKSEWLGLAAGFLFALGNVLVRKLVQHTDAEKSLVIWAGVAIAAIAHLGSSATPAADAMAVAAAHWLLIVAIGIGLAGMGLALQYGLARLPANRAILILLFELVVAAVAAWLLAGESLRIRDWIGGALIVAATLLSASRPGAEPDLA